MYKYFSTLHCLKTTLQNKIKMKFNLFLLLLATLLAVGSSQQQKTYTIRDPKSKLYWAADKTNHIGLQVAGAKWILTTAPGGFTISPSNNPDLYVTYKGNGNLLTLEGNILS